MRRKNCKLIDQTLPPKTINSNNITSESIHEILKNIKSTVEEMHNQALKDIKKLENGQLINLETNDIVEENRILHKMIKTIDIVEKEFENMKQRPNSLNNPGKQ